RADYAAVVGINLICGGGDIIGAAGADGFDRSDDVFVLLVAQALDLAIDFFRRCDATAGRVYVDDDGFDGVVFAELLELRDGGGGIDDDAFEIDDADFVAEAAGERGVLAGMEGQIDEREYGQNEEEESSSTDENPKPDAGTLFVGHI